jgi:hypothetical protein
MALRVEIYDKTIPVLDYIAERSLLYVKSFLHQAGMDIKDEAKDHLESFRHNWHHLPKAKFKKTKKVKSVHYKDNRVIFYSSETKKLGEMIDHKTGAVRPTENVSKIISSYVSKGGLSVTIGGAHRPFSVDYIDTKGRSKTHRVKKGRGSVSKAIFHKLNTGEINKDHPYFEKDGGFESDHGRYKARPFMDMAMSSAMNIALKKADHYYSKLLPKDIQQNTRNLHAKIISTRKTA